MEPRSALPDWNALAGLGDDELPLLDTALLIARDEYPDLDARAITAQVETYAATLRPRVDGDVDLPSRLTAINRYLFEEIGFAANVDQYDDPRNSYLNEVVDRKLGIPISLAVVHEATGFAPRRQMARAQRGAVPAPRWFRASSCELKPARRRMTSSRPTLPPPARGPE